jgi:hypothetical protein
LDWRSPSSPHSWQAEGDGQRGGQHYREALGVYRAVYGNEHRHVATCLFNLAIVLKDQGRVEEAKPLLQESLAIRRQIFSPGHAEIAKIENALDNPIRVADE